MVWLFQSFFQSSFPASRALLPSSSPLCCLILPVCCGLPCQLGPGYRAASRRPSGEWSSAAGRPQSEPGTPAHCHPHTDAGGHRFPRIQHTPLPSDVTYRASRRRCRPAASPAGDRASRPPDQLPISYRAGRRQRALATCQGLPQNYAT